MKLEIHGNAEFHRSVTLSVTALNVIAHTVRGLCVSGGTGTLPRLLALAAVPREARLSRRAMMMVGRCNYTTW